MPAAGSLKPDISLAFYLYPPFNESYIDLFTVFSLVSDKHGNCTRRLRKKSKLQRWETFDQRLQKVSKQQINIS